MYDVAGIAWGRAKVAVVGVMKQLYFVHLCVSVDHLRLFQKRWRNDSKVFSLKIQIDLENF